MKRIVIFKEKHGQDIYDDSTDEELYVVLYRKMVSRNLEGWYGTQIDLEKEEAKAKKNCPLSDVTEEMVMGIPDAARAVIMGLAKKDKERFRHTMLSVHEELEESQLFKQVLETPEEEAVKMTHPNLGRRNLVHYLMASRSNYEYEDWDVRKIS